MTLRISRLAVLALVALATLLAPDVLVAHADACSTAPVGASSSSTEPEPQQAVWCVTGLSAPPTTGTLDGFGGFIDQFGTTTSPVRLNDGDGGYHVTDLAAGGTAQSQHFEANGYFVGDVLKSAPDQGTDLSPAQSFTFQGGKLVLEADVAAGIPGFSNPGDIFWPEVVWSTSPTPVVADSVEGLYSYGYYGGSWAAGCRLQARHAITCGVETSAGDRPLPGETQDHGPCFPAASSRVMELSGHEACGTTHSGFADDSGTSPLGVFRSCIAGQVDPCLDRFRFEWSASGLVVYVNGIKYAEDSGWDANHQLPDAIVNGSTPVYAHFADFGDFSDGNVYRVHWQRIAVNPHDAAGNPLPPSASPTFGQTPPSPTPSPSSTATPTPTPNPTPRPAQVMKGVPCTVGGVKGICWGAFQPS